MGGLIRGGAPQAPSALIMFSGSKDVCQHCRLPSICLPAENYGKTVSGLHLGDNVGFAV